MPAKDAPAGRELLDYQHFRETIADEWTRRQVAAIRSVDAQALVTAGLIQWSVPVILAGPFHYSAFRPERQVKLLDFMEIHFYPLANGFYEYRNDEDEARNLAYLECAVHEVARWGKPTVIAECGWYGGGKPAIDGGRHAAATEEQQARWCRKLVETTAGEACGWLNWSFHDHPGAGDVTELIGLLAADGRRRRGAAFEELAQGSAQSGLPAARPRPRPALPWDNCISDPTGDGRLPRALFPGLSGGTSAVATGCWPPSAAARSRRLAHLCGGKSTLCSSARGLRPIQPFHHSFTFPVDRLAPSCRDKISNF